MRQFLEATRTNHPRLCLLIDFIFIIRAYIPINPIERFRTSLFGSWFLLNDLHHLCLDCFLFEDQSILVPDEVRDALVDIIFLHTIFKLFNDIFIVWILSKTKFFAVVQNIGEALLVALAQLLNRHFHLLLFNV